MLLIKENYFPVTGVGVNTSGITVLSGSLHQRELCLPGDSRVGGYTTQSQDFASKHIFHFWDKKGLLQGRGSRTNQVQVTVLNVPAQDMLKIPVAPGLTENVRGKHSDEGI